ncbi:MAG: sugar O-acyltransferase, sialic acid O-acetyltransferase NeuD family [Gemmatimonadetes bacterium]|nr:sugar O-acyltransferase, sialic acid O-acetyltransferase NeuD family [Gemmatimonadota bacterium]
MTHGDGKPLIIYGAGGFGREVAWLASEAREPRHVAAFASDDAPPGGTTLAGLPLLSLDEAARANPGADFIVAVGSASARVEMSHRAEKAGLVATRLIHRRVEMSDRVLVGKGTVICAGCILTVDIRLGEHVQINLDCTIGHDAVLEDCVTLAPGVHVSGWVRLESGAYVGTGASIINGTSASPLVIGAHATIGAGAVVTKAIAPRVTAVGIPARARA